jgi:hypothetical protein
MLRWTKKTGEPMDGRLIGFMSFPDGNCVSLNLKPGSVGGVPIYCYAIDKSDTMPKRGPRLIAEYSDVE